MKTTNSQTAKSYLLSQNFFLNPLDPLVGWGGVCPFPFSGPSTPSAGLATINLQRCKMARGARRLVLSAFGASHLGAFGASIQTPQADTLNAGT